MKLALNFCLINSLTSHSSFRDFVYFIKFFIKSQEIETKMSSSRFLIFLVVVVLTVLDGSGGEERTLSRNKRFLLMWQRYETINVSCGVFYGHIKLYFFFFFSWRCALLSRLKTIRCFITLNFI